MKITSLTLLVASLLLPSAAFSGDSVNLSRIVPPGCSEDQPIDSCAPMIKPYDCALGKHWTTQGGNGLAHCVADDMACPVDYSITHDALGNPSCYFNPAPVASGDSASYTNKLTAEKPPETKKLTGILYDEAGSSAWQYWAQSAVALYCVADGTGFSWNALSEGVTMTEAGAISGHSGSAPANFDPTCVVGETVVDDWVRYSCLPGEFIGDLYISRCKQEYVNIYRTCIFNSSTLQTSCTESATGYTR